MQLNISWCVRIRACDLEKSYCSVYHGSNPVKFPYTDAASFLGLLGSKIEPIQSSKWRFWRNLSNLNYAFLEYSTFVYCDT